MSPTSKEHEVVFLTTARKVSAPYLPPPLLRLIHETDKYFHLQHASLTNDHCYDEPSMAMLSSLFLAYMILRGIQGIWSTSTKRSTAHLTGDEDTAVLGGLATKGGGVGGSRNKQGGDTTLGGHESPPFLETVVLCGASNSGKTALLHFLTNAEMMKDSASSYNPPMTVTSLVANVGYISQDATETNGDEKNAIRIIDYPGHPSLSSQLTTLLLPSATSRLLFTLDATQPVTVGAALLYQSILTHSQIRQSWTKEGKDLDILVVCTKNDEKGAKNYKRMKIQLRNDLDKLRKVDLAIQESSSASSNGVKATLSVKGKSIDLDNLGEDVPVSLYFVEAGFGMDSGKSGGMVTIRDFVLTGALPSVK